MDLQKIRQGYISNKYSTLDATNKTCQDAILSKISKCTLSQHITVKGGVIISHISKDKRRVTKDLDLDFIRYSLDDDSIINFIAVLNDVNDGIMLKLIGPIELLSHQEYQGKRINISLSDEFGTILQTKLDLGVHSKLDIGQENYCFELAGIGENIILLANTIEQMFTEKLATLLKHGRFSTRYKDIFDFYYFITAVGLDKKVLLNCFEEYIFQTPDMREQNVDDVQKRLRSILSNKEFLRRANTAHSNWLDLQIDVVTDRILEFFKNELV